jgi:hypothetical protein
MIKNVANNVKALAFVDVQADGMAIRLLSRERKGQRSVGGSVGQGRKWEFQQRFWGTQGRVSSCCLSVWSCLAADMGF